MVWQTFTHSKNTDSGDNLTSSISLSPVSPLPSPPRTPIPTLPSTPSVTATINHTQHKSSSNERPSSPPRPPPRFHRPTPKSSSSSDSHNTDNTSHANTSGYGTPHNDLPFSMTPAGRFFSHFFNEAMQYFNYPMHDIVWSEEPPTTNACNGNSINEKIIDNDEKFSIEIDLSDFLTGELLINYDEEGRELLVEGHQKERNDRYGSVERNFKRKFDIPIDAHDGSLAAYLFPTGLLTIQAFKKHTKQPIRRIPIQEVVDIPDKIDKNTTKPSTNKNTTNKANINSSVSSKSKTVSESKFPTFEKMSKIAEKIPKIPKIKEDKMKQLNFDEKQKSTDGLSMKREYLNIFC
ncbi:unnamed protein product [Cercopithifilaria johnstoni]|uniref:SHSP domain-containing protein n=1 Tax=Cercopithifilaria johnstoni TaxID=2874296 RepID=A0A8J2MEW5_9BILA|nr:unnamed protein product [Cercopithifilaria johnstoni]